MKNNQINNNEKSTNNAKSETKNDFKIAVIQNKILEFYFESKTQIKVLIYKTISENFNLSIVLRELFESISFTEIQNINFDAINKSIEAEKGELICELNITFDNKINIIEKIDVNPILPLSIENKYKDKNFIEQLQKEYRFFYELGHYDKFGYMIKYQIYKKFKLYEEWESFIYENPIFEKIASISEFITFGIKEIETNNPEILSRIKHQNLNAFIPQLRDKSLLKALGNENQIHPNLNMEEELRFELKLIDINNVEIVIGFPDSNFSKLESIVAIGKFEFINGFWEHNVIFKTKEDGLNYENIKHFIIRNKYVLIRRSLLRFPSTQKYDFHLSV